MPRRRSVQKYMAGLQKKSMLARAPDAYWLRERYGITVEDYNRMYREQNGKCAICKRKVKYRLHVDHCHKTGIVRGLLCAPCNRGLGLFKDDQSRLRSAIKYLAKSLQIADS